MNSHQNADDYEPVRPNMTGNNSKEYGNPTQAQYGEHVMSYASEEDEAEEVRSNIARSHNPAIRSD
jgi:hypothetical protein